jgi:hypothetical protein
VRTGWPADDEQDYDLSIWAGVVPFTHRTEAPISDPLLRFPLDPPDYVVHYQRQGGAADARV